MNELGDRVASLEAASEKTAERVLALERDVGVWKAVGATKADIAEAKSEILVKVAESESKLHTEIVQAEAKLSVQIDGVTSNLRVDIADAKSSLLMWVVTAIFLAQLLPALLKQLIG